MQYAYFAVVIQKKNFYLEILVDMRQMNFDFVKLLFDTFILSFFELFPRSISKHSDIVILISIGKPSKQTYQKVKNRNTYFCTKPQCYTYKVSDLICVTTIIK